MTNPFKYIKRKLYNVMYGLPFAMKAGDELLATSNQSEEGSAIHKQQENKNVFADLLRGEVTQQVEELRWETFRAEELSNNYQHIGQGVSIKVGEDLDTIKGRMKKFTILNQTLYYGTSEAVTMIVENNGNSDVDLPTRKLIKISYKECPKHRIENACYKMRFLNEGKTCVTELFFIKDMYNSNRPFTNFLKKTIEDLSVLTEVQRGYYKDKNELFSNVDSMEFTTLNATNNVPNGLEYKLTKPVLEEIGEDEEYYILKYRWREWSGGVLLSERFPSKTAEEKFSKKLKKENPTLVVLPETFEGEEEEEDARGIERGGFRSSWSDDDLPEEE